MSVYLPRRARGRTEAVCGAQRAQEQFYALLRANAGAGSYRRKDPVYALAESFAQTFDLMGRQRVRAAAGLEPGQLQGVNMLPYIADDNGRYLRRFSQYAFQNGRLAGAILQGRGELALHVCIRRAAGLAGLTGTEVRRKIDKTADHRRVAQTEDWVHFGGDPHAAVALVAGVTRSASQLLREIRKAGDQLEGAQVTTLREVFPFLYEDEDRELIEQLSRKQRQMQLDGKAEGAQYRAVCAALDKARAMLSKKRQMRAEFLNRLDVMLYNARQAEELFGSEAFAESVERSLTAETEAGEAEPDAEKPGAEAAKPGGAKA